MARLDVYSLPGLPGRGYVVDVQANLVAHLKTRVVIPLLPEADAPPPIGELNPVIRIAGESYVLISQSIATVSVKQLKAATMSLAFHRDEITRALDTLFLGR